MVTDPQTNKQIQPANPQTGPITIHCAAASVQCEYAFIMTTVAHQYSTLKNETLQYRTQLNNQCTILYTILQRSPCMNVMQHLGIFNFKHDHPARSIGEMGYFDSWSP